jgi:NAD(P)H dehydrogenase (quinone)
MPALVDDHGVIRGPAGQGRVAAVAQDDIADAATAVLLDPDQHAGVTYSLTGPEALTLDEVAATLSAELERPVRYYAETLEEAFTSRSSYGAPDWQVDAWVSTYTAIASGEVADVTDDIEQLTGHQAMSLAELVRKGRAAY